MTRAREYSGPCRDCGVDTSDSTASARESRRCSTCYNKRARARLRGEARPEARVGHGSVSPHRYTTCEAETVEDLQRWDARRDAQRARDIAAIEAITDEYRPARRHKDG